MSHSSSLQLYKEIKSTIEMSSYLDKSTNINTEKLYRK